MAKTVKTNAARILEKNKIPYRLLSYQTDGTPKSGRDVAALLGVHPETVYKTLVTQGASKNYFVFVIPAEAELDLKKSALSIGEKNVELIPVKKLFETTGYIRGGCSPVGMKKQFATVFDETALLLSKISVSAGKIGYHIEADPNDLIKITNGKTADIIR